MASAYGRNPRLNVGRCQTRPEVRQSGPMKPEPSIFDEVDDEADARRDADARADIEAGRVIPNDEVCAWLETWGTPAETPPPDKWFK